MIPVTFDTVATLQFGSESHPTSLHFAIPEEWKTCKIKDATCGAATVALCPRCSWTKMGA